jgi:ribosomal-protein-alanine N-acetyltransferase
MTIRDLTEADAAAAAALTQGWSAADYRAIARGDFPDRFCLVIGDLSALILASVVAPGAEILNVFMRSGLRRQGIGSALLRAALDRMQAAGVYRVWLEVRESNTAALDMYRAAGFRQTGRRLSYYETPKENALVLETILKRS